MKIRHGVRYREILHSSRWSVRLGAFHPFACKNFRRSVCDQFVATNGLHTTLRADAETLTNRLRLLGTRSAFSFSDWSDAPTNSLRTPIMQDVPGRKAANIVYASDGRFSIRESIGRSYTRLLTCLSGRNMCSSFVFQRHWPLDL